MMIVVIPARGGSKGIPDKNKKELCGKPLIQYTVDAAREIFQDKDIIVSTDDPTIKSAVEAVGLEVPFMRPPELGLDTVGTDEVLHHVLDTLGKEHRNPETIVLLQPTSPFRTARHILEAVELFDNSLDMVLSVKETAANPYYLLREENSEGYLEKSKTGNFKRRQDCPKVWEINGAIYVINTESLRSKSIGEFSKVKKYVMKDIPSHDIDTPLDWIFAETLIREHLVQL